MIKKFVIIQAITILAIGTICSAPALAQDAKPASQQVSIALPAPELTSKVTVEQALQQRRSVRSYAAEPITLQQVSRLLWAAQGITDPATGHRTAPSAQATYPLRVYLVAGNVKDLPAGIYEYIPQGHKLELVASGDQRANMGSQPQMVNAPVMLAYVADYSVTGKKYGDAKAKEFAYIEMGHSAQNVLLEEIALGLIGVPMGGIDEAKMRTTLKLTENQEPVYLISAARKG